ncbi:MAG: hypothetical protein ABW168_10200 [Sedimenticola sp.]
MLIDSFTIPATHPSLAGHFPGNPIIPGVVILDHLLSILNSKGVEVTSFTHAKFVKSAKGGQKIDLEVEHCSDITNFKLRHAGELIAYGEITIT